jgi:hypothetical protein
MGSRRTIRGILVFQAATFLSAASIHFGVLMGGYRHREAGTAESVIATVLLVGLALTWMPATWARRAAVAAQTFAIVGVLVGLFTIAIGIGPRTMLDLTYHAVMLAALIAGLAVTLRSGPVRPHTTTTPQRSSR